MLGFNRYHSFTYPQSGFKVAADDFQTEVIADGLAENRFPSICVDRQVDLKVVVGAIIIIRVLMHNQKFDQTLNKITRLEHSEVRWCRNFHVGARKAVIGTENKSVRNRDICVIQTRSP